MHTQSRASRPPNGLDAFFVCGGQSHQGAASLGGLGSGLRNPRQEKAQPRLPVTGEPHLLEQFIVPLAVLFEVQAEVKQRLLECPFGTEQKSDEQSSQAPVSIQERM